MKFHRGTKITGNGLSALDCEQCGFIHLFPLPKAEEVQKRYASGKFYAEDKPNYRADEERDREWLEGVCYPMQMALVTNALLDSGESWLDIGCGYGHFQDWILRHGFYCKGLEPAPIQQLKPDIYGMIKDSLIENTDYAPEEFNVIRMAWVLEHLLNPQEILRKLYGWLKPNGVLLVIVPNDFSIIQQAVSALNNPNGIKPNYWLHSTHINYFGYASLAQLFVKTRFRIITKFGTFPMEQFLLAGDNYLGNDNVGQICHERRKRMELSLINSGDAGRETFMRMGFALAQAELGRDMIFVGRKDK